MWLLLAFGSSWAALVVATASCSWDDLVSNFSSPEAEHRLKLRYWIHDASADLRVVREDVHTFASVGAGGFELLPYYQITGAPPSNWSEYGFGSEAYRRLFRTAMEAADDHNLLMDFAVAPNQGQGVPAEPGTPGLAYHLAYSNVTLGADGTFDGVLPLSAQPSDSRLFFMHELEEFGTQQLHATLAIEVLPKNSWNRSYSLVGRVINLTPEVDPVSRYLQWKAPDTKEGSIWRIMAWYERYTNQRSIDSGPNASETWQNGSWIVDHFSSLGSKLMTDFFDSHVVVDPGERELLARVGKYAWEDSMEMNSVLWWTPEMETKLRKRYHRDFAECLPFLLCQENAWAQLYVPYNEEFVSADAHHTSVCKQHYRNVLQEGYEEYVQGFIDWAHARGIEYSNQPAYNLPLSMIDSARLADAPEVESFGFQDSIDSYRHMSGPAHVAGNSVISNELGAVPRAAYAQSIGQVLFSFHRGLAGGISMNVLHGFPYSGAVVNTTWPGLTIFGFMYSEMWGPRQPQWSSFPAMVDYISRSQYIIQTGKPRVDLAIYANDAPFPLDSGYENEYLQAAGFTYDYVGPASLGNVSIKAKGGILAPDGPAYKGLVIPSKANLTMEAALQIRHFAAEGLPIIFVGDYGTGSLDDRDMIDAVIREVLDTGYSRVIRINSMDHGFSFCSDLRICPNVNIVGAKRANGLHSFWRSTEEAELIWLFNEERSSEDGTADQIEVEFLSMGRTKPYSFDPWTGLTEPILHYSVSPSGLIVPVSLSVNQTIIVALRHDLPDTSPENPEIIVQAVSGAVAGIVTLSQPGSRSVPGIQLQRGPASIGLSNGTSLMLYGNPPERTNLTSWLIKITSWRRANDSSSVETALDSYTYTDSSLVPWTELDGQTLNSVSGVGRYSTSFVTQNSQERKKLGAFLHLGSFRDTLRIWLNEQELTPRLIPSGNATVIDISNYLSRHSGQNINELTIDVATSLFNRIKAEANLTESMGIPASFPEGSGPIFSESPPLQYGLVGPAWVEWVEVIELH